MTMQELIERIEKDLPKPVRVRRETAAQPAQALGRLPATSPRVTLGDLDRRGIFV